VIASMLLLSSIAASTGVQSTVVMAAYDRAAADREIRANVAQQGGYVAQDDRRYLVLRVKPEHLASTLAFIKERGTVLDERRRAEDRNQRLAMLDAQLSSKQQILERMYELLAEADVRATRTIEQRLTQMVVEIEQVKGKLRVERELAKWATVEVRYQTEAVPMKAPASPSPFAWINSVSLDSFLGGF
jgi:hypothetical protein